MATAGPSLTATDDYGVVNHLWEITDPVAITSAQDALRGAKFYIADGHHRYETALAYASRVACVRACLERIRYASCNSLSAMPAI